jgi:hypothetical protein
MAVARCIAIMSPAPICGAIKPVYAGGSAWLLLFQGGSPVAICFC